MNTENQLHTPGPWIDPNDKTQKQFLPWIGEKVWFCHNGKTYQGHHTGGSFKSGRRHFNTWECRWMYQPAPITPTGANHE